MATQIEGGSRATAAASDHDAARPMRQSASVLPNRYYVVTTPVPRRRRSPGYFVLVDRQWAAVGWQAADR
jgi:hypothetical protein